MPVEYSVTRSVKEIEAFKRSLYVYFSSRGVPSSKHQEQYHKWVKKKGYRLPQV